MDEACSTVLTTEVMTGLVTLTSLVHSHSLFFPAAEECPKLIEGSWNSALKSLQWFVENRTSVAQFAERYKVGGAPGPEWWAIALVVTNVAERVNNVARHLQNGKGLSHDRQHILDLMSLLSMMTGAVGPFLASELFSISCEDIVIGSFSINPVSAATFLKSQLNFSSSIVDSFETEAYQGLVDSTSTFVLTVLTKLNQIISESKGGVDKQTEEVALNHVPPFLPHALCNMRHQDFVKALQQQRVLLETFSSDEIERIEVQHRSLRNQYLLENRVREEIDNQSDSSSFSKVWQNGICAGIEYRELRSFSGAIAAVGSKVTQHPLALINWCKAPFSQSLTDFSLEAILHAQDYSLLASFRMG
ncbi:unnamed protein product [Phytophthora fragariaefolia]|uniref:Unnamed protein product n=1 Tax=Phytophthora fragariaefolia TaxID=1490495 RepID=A0A9W6TXA2_9STRA|nr:unnamed protein product [Phytophthora fragariaefolia]